MLRALIFVLFVNFAFVTPTTLVPRIGYENGYQLEPGNGQYTLSIRNPDGSAGREETVREIAPGILEVKGTLNQAFDNEQGGQLVVTYEAGPNGYVAKYSYKAAGQREPPLYVGFLSPVVLKSAAG